MIGLLLIVWFWIITVAFSIHCGAEAVALYLYKRHRISESEYEELTSFKFLFKAIHDA